MTAADQRIVDAAVELIARRGYAATTTKEIARTAGVNEVTLFRRFGSKAGILAAIGERLAQGERPYDLSPDETDLRAGLLRAARQEIEQVGAYGACAARLAFDAADDPDVAAALASAAGPGANLARLTELFAAWQGQGRVRTGVAPRVLAEGFAALTGSLLLGRLVLHAGGEPADILALVDIYCDGVLTA